VTPAPDRPSSTCLGTLFPVKRPSERPGMMYGRNLYGMTAKAPAELAVLARSWNSPAELRSAGDGFESRGYDRNQRAYVLVSRRPGAATAVDLVLEGSKDRPIVNPAFVLRNWGEAGAAIVLGGREVPRGSAFRWGHVPTLEGTDLVVWIQAESQEPLALRLEPR
jgi:hypothetical protein